MSDNSRYVNHAYRSAYPIWVNSYPLWVLTRGVAVCYDEHTMTLRDAEFLAWSLMKHHGLTAQGWTFQFDRAKERLGCCKPRRKIITLSALVTPGQPDDDVKDTILHEIAHALCPPREGHGPIWKAMARAIGARPERCGQIAAPVPAKYIVTCPKCQVQTPRHRLPRKSRLTGKPALMACSACCNRYNRGKFSYDFLLTYQKV